MRVFVTLFALLACAYSEVTVSRITSDKFKDIRLPTDVVPERYRLQILPVLEEGNFSTFGEAEIDVLCKEKTNRIVLHATTLEIDENSVSLSLGKTIPKRDVIFVKQRERFVPKGRKISKSNNEVEENFKDEPELKEMVYDETKETVTFVFDSFMKSDERYTLKMDFRGSVPADLKGFYRSSFVDKAGTKKWLAVTQFEPTDARRAFPCFDEPAMKATFEVTLGRKEGMTTVTNMPLIRSEAIPQRPGWIWDHYEKTVPMSTYLVAFLVSDFEYRVAETYVRDPPLQIEAIPDEMSPADALEDSTDLPSTDAPVTPSTPQPGPEIRVWTRHDAIDQAGLALNVTPSMLSFLEKYFDIHYPLPKLDLVGLPDFAAGAMENWGLITYRERAVLYDPERSSAKDKLYVQKVIAHELAHQWFGNLVTMKWWSDLWLNEGFATYVQGLAIHHVEPEWDYPSYFALEIQDVLGLDSLESSHPVSVEVLHPDQITESFDTISYKKGASIIRMMNFFLGEPTFRQGLTNYLNEKKYDNAEQDDLWQALTDQAHKDGTLTKTMTVKAIMDTWTLKKGYPVVTVNRNYKDGSASLNQKRFLLNPESEEIELPKSVVQEDKTKTKKKNRFISSRQKSSSTDSAPAPNTVETPTSTVPPSATEAIDYSWWVPITATGGAQADFDATKTLIWMSPEQKQVEFKHKVESSQWLIVNVQRTGFFRVNYDSVNWQLLINQLRADHTRIHPVNRAQLLDDAFAFAAAGELPYTTALELSRYLVRERDTVPIESFLKDWRALANIFKYTPEYGLFKKVQTKLLLPTHMHRGFLRQEGESGLEAITRASVVGAICGLDAPECVENAKDLYKQWMNGTDPDAENPIQSDVSGAVYCAAIRHGGEEEWDFLKNRVSKVNIASQRDTMLAALGCTREPWLLLRYISAAFVDSKNRVAWGIRKQDWRTVASSVAGNPVGRSIIADFVKERWDDIQNFYGSVLTPLRLLQTSVATYSTPIQLEEVRSFIASKAANLTTALGTVRRILDSVATNVNWKKRHYATVSQWLEKEAESSIIV